MGEDFEFRTLRINRQKIDVLRSLRFDQEIVQGYRLNFDNGVSLPVYDRLADQ